MGLSDMTQRKLHFSSTMSLAGLVGLFCLLATAEPVAAQQDSIDEEQLKFFENRIRPQLVKNCYGCHSQKSGKLRGGLALDTRQATLAGGNSGPAVVPHDLEQSLLWTSINYEDYEMPPSEPLPEDVIADFKKWIEMGAPDPREAELQQAQSEITAADIQKAAAEFWAFQPPALAVAASPAAAPTTSEGGGSDNAWAQTEIDRFVWNRLAEQGLQPAPDAEPHVVLRRLTMDLIGLPPTPEQLDFFEERWRQDPQQAVAMVVDTLLDRPQFGERWARHWLDVARYAESSGKERNLTYPHAWRYRDYVIDSFNEDKRYDRFVIEQIAGDLLPAINDAEWVENTVATGFLAVGPKTLVERNRRQFELDLVDEQIDVTTRVFLGMSVACARCHDHKFDAIPQTDYYALAGIFQSTQTMYGTVSTAQNRNPSQLIQLPADQPGVTADIEPGQLRELREGLADKLQEANELRRKLRSEGREASSAADVRRRIALQQEIGVIRARIEAYDDRGRAYAFCMGAQSDPNPQDARLLVRGEFNQPAEKVARAVPQVLTRSPIEIPGGASGRLELARWIADEANPLTARVMVNRIWLHLFGEGLVRTPENFGVTGQLPTHPELLDHLAVRFMENDWSIKQLIREIAVSRAYRMSSTFDERSFLADPENKNLWRYPPRRLDAEVLRDSMLAISGELDKQRPMGSLIAELGDATIREGRVISAAVGEQANRGRSEMVRLQGRMADLGGLVPRVTEIDAPVTFRSVYLPIVREYVPRALEVFDFAESSMVIGKRETSNTPDQGLYLLNNEFVIAQSDAMARRLIQHSDSLRRQIQQAYILAYGRRPTAAELNTGVNFVNSFDVDVQAPVRRNNTGPGSRIRNRLQRNPYAQRLNRAAGNEDRGEAVGLDEVQQRKLSAFCQALFASAEFRYLD